jgi:CRP-like cAMP-binding protein
VRTLASGDSFGEICAILPDIKRTATVKAKNYCTTATLDKCDLDSLCEVYPILRERLLKQIQEYRDFWKEYVSKYLMQVPYLRKLRHIELIQMIYLLKRIHFQKGKDII